MHFCSGKRCNFTLTLTRVADGPPQRIGDKGMQHMPGEDVWLVGERRASGEQKYYLADLPDDADLRTLAATIKARWVCEQAHQQLRRNSASTTSKDAHGKVWIATR
jgi:SRSO17 transposase